MIAQLVERETVVGLRLRGADISRSLVRIRVARIIVLLRLHGCVSVLCLCLVYAFAARTQASLATQLPPPPCARRTVLVPRLANTQANMTRAAFARGLPPPGQQGMQVHDQQFVQVRTL